MAGGQMKEIGLTKFSLEAFSSFSTAFVRVVESKKIDKSVLIPEWARGACTDQATEYWRGVQLR